MEHDFFANFLRVLEFYKLKQIPRDSSNHYEDEKDGVSYQRRETTAEHVYSCFRLADYFLTNEAEFLGLDRLKVYDMLMYHDDLETITRDIGISKRDERVGKKDAERKALPILLERVPTGVDERLLKILNEYEEQKTPEAKFAKAIDKMDSLVHEFQYPQDWGPKDFGEKNVRKWFQPAFDYSPTFSKYFETTIGYLRTNGYFNN